MQRKDVKEKMEKFLYHLRQEQEMRDEVASLNYLAVPPKELQENLKRESQLLAQMETLRQEKMLPILKDLAQFVSSRCQATARASAKKPAAQPKSKRVTAPSAGKKT